MTSNRGVYRSHTFIPVTVLEVRIICQAGPPNSPVIYGRLNEVEIYGEPEPLMPPFSVQNGRFAFSSLTDVERLTDYLDFKYDQHSDAFASQYAGKTDAELEVLEESTGFDDNKPYIDFENAYGITTMRAIVAQQEEVWLETTTGDDTAPHPDPDDSYGGFDEERALL